MDEDSPVAIPSLGLAYHVRNRVHAVAPGSPAAAAGLHSGDVIAKATVLPPDDETLEQLRKEFPHSLSSRTAELELLFDETHQNWPFFMYAPARRRALGERQVELQWDAGQRNREASRLSRSRPRAGSTPIAASLRTRDTFRQTADSFREALRWGTAKTLDYTLLVFTLDAKIAHRAGLGPHISAVRWRSSSGAMQTAKEGIGNLLVFLTLISANLAVINFLPIPMFDGGHMVFLAWEGIRGKPPDERVQLALTYCGLLLILALMVWVLGLDLHLISRIPRVRE